MRELTLNTRFKRALKGESIDMVPVCSVTQTGTVELMEMTGAYWPQANYDAAKMAALALGGYEIAGFENVRCPFCTTVLAETLGCTVDEGSVDIQPYVTDFPCKKKKDVKDISVPDSLLESRLTSVVLDAVEILKERVGEDVPVVAGVVGPAGLASMLAGMRNYLMWFVTNPEVVVEWCIVSALKFVMPIHSKIINIRDNITKANRTYLFVKTNPPHTKQFFCLIFIKVFCQLIEEDKETETNSPLNLISLLNSTAITCIRETALPVIQVTGSLISLYTFP